MAKPTAKSTPMRAGRGRPKKADIFGAAPVVATDPPKKRGRTSTVAAVVKEPFVELEPTSIPPKKRGRPSKAAAQAVDAPQPKTTTITPPPKKRAGRPPKAATASSLNRVAGSPRVSKRALVKRVSTAAAPKPVARIDPRVRSKLRMRTAPVKKKPAPAEAPKKRATKKETTSVQAPKKRGRPAAATKAATKPTAGSGRGRPRKDASAPVAAKKAPKTARQAISKPIAPRKRRGYTTLEVPDKFAAQMQQHLLDLETAEEVPEEVADEGAEEEQDYSSQGQDVNAEVNPVDEDEDAEEGAQEVLQLVVDVKPAEEETYEEEAGDFAGDPDEPVGEIEVEYEIREETIIEEPTNEEFQMQGVIEDEFNGAPSSELTPGYDDDFEESAHEASILEQSMGGNDASGLFA